MGGRAVQARASGPPGPSPEARRSPTIAGHGPVPAVGAPLPAPPARAWEADDAAIADFVALVLAWRDRVEAALRSDVDGELLIDPLRALTALLLLAFLGLWYSTRWGVPTWLVGIVGVVAFALALAVLRRHPPTR